METITITELGALMVKEDRAPMDMTPEQLRGWLHQVASLPEPLATRPTKMWALTDIRDWLEITDYRHRSLLPEQGRRYSGLATPWQEHNAPPRLRGSWHDTPNPPAHADD